MLVQHRLELSFATAHVQDPLIWEMTRKFHDLMFNINSLNVGVHEADMRLSLYGEPPVVKQAKAYLKELGVTVKTLSSCRYRGCIPDVPVAGRPAHQDQATVQRKLWLTILGSNRRDPCLWMIARRFAATYKIMQCASGEKVAIISLLLSGSVEEVDGVVSYLRGQGIHVEYGEVGVDAPFIG